MKPCGNCSLPTSDHVLIANDGVCHGCAEKQDKAQQEIIRQQYLEYMRLRRR